MVTADVQRLMVKCSEGTRVYSFALISFLSTLVTQGLMLQVSHAAQEAGLLSLSFSQSSLFRIICVEELKFT